MDDTPLDEAERKEIDRITAERVRAGDVVIVTDFGHGMIAPEHDRCPDRATPSSWRSTPRATAETTATI